MENNWIHDLLLFLTAVFAAYAAWKGRDNGTRIEAVQKQTDGMAKALATEAKAAGRAEGKEEAVREITGGAPPLP